MKFKCTYCKTKLVQDNSIPIVLDNEPHTTEGYYCPKCEVVFFKNREFKRRKEALVHMEGIVEGEVYTTTKSPVNMCICGDPYIKMTLDEKDRQNIWIDGKKHKTWAFWCENCGTIVPISVRQIKWQKTQNGIPFKIKEPKIIKKAKFKISMRGNKCTRKIDYIMLDGKQVKVIADVGKGCYSVYIILNKEASEVKPMH